MYSLLILSVADTNVKHLSIHDNTTLADDQSHLINEVRAGIFPNSVFQDAYNKSERQDVSVIVISPELMVQTAAHSPDDYKAYCHTEARRAGHALVAESAKTPNHSIQEFSNVGDWLGHPGVFSIDSNPVQVTDIYKYMVKEGLLQRDVLYSFESPTSILEDRGVMSHLLPRDAYYDQAYRDVNGKRVFFGYVKAGDDNPVGTFPIVVEGLPYPSIDAAALAYNIPVEWVYDRLDSTEARWHNWIYEATLYPTEVASSVNQAADVVPNQSEQYTGGGNPNAKQVSIRGKVYPSIVDAVRVNAGWDLTPSTIHRRLRQGDDTEIFYCDAEGNKIV